MSKYFCHVAQLYMYIVIVVYPPYECVQDTLIYRPLGWLWYLILSLYKLQILVCFLYTLWEDKSHIHVYVDFDGNWFIALLSAPLNYIIIIIQYVFMLQMTWNTLYVYLLNDTGTHLCWQSPVWIYVCTSFIYKIVSGRI